MPEPFKPSASARRHIHQHGAALVIALIFLVAMTLLGLASVSNNQLQQRMTYGSAQSNLAFQAAESALISGENWITRQPLRPVPDCASPCEDSAAIWPATPTAGTPEVSLPNLRDPDWWNDEGRLYGRDYAAAGPVAIVDQALPWLSAANQPRYVVEELGKEGGGSLVIGLPTPYTVWYYQVTARGQGNAPTNQVGIVQSVFARGY